MKSLFVTGSDTDVGKTYVTAGLAVLLKKHNIDVGVMKPFAAGTPQKKGFKSEDAEILSFAAGVHDQESLINPQFFPIAASPYTATRNLGIKPKIKKAIQAFAKLQKSHQMLLVEGMGGIMTPIKKDYFVINMIKEMGLEALIVCRSKVGTINHTLMTCKICKDFDIPIRGLIINNFDSGGYPPKELKRDLQALTGEKVIGIIPFIKNLDNDSLASSFEKNISLRDIVT